MQEPTKANAIRLDIPRRLYLLPCVATTLGFSFGLLRGSRRASLRFLAENAHRQPTTIRGWYLYNKTKNYKVFLAGLRGGGKEAARLGVVGLGWVGLEEACVRTGHGCDEWREVVAGGGTGAIMAALCE